MPENRFLEYLFLALIGTSVVGVPLMIYADISKTEKATASCEAQGGTYLIRDRICIEVKTLEVQK